MKSHSSEEGQRDSVSARTEWVQKLRMFMSLQERLGGYAHYSDDLKKILLPRSQISIQLLVVVIAIFLNYPYQRVACRIHRYPPFAEMNS